MAHVPLNHSINEHSSRSVTSVDDLSSAHRPDEQDNVTSASLPSHVDHEDDGDAIAPIPHLPAVSAARDISQGLENSVQQDHGSDRNRIVSRPTEEKEPSKTESALRYRKRTVWILLFYIPLLIVPWTLTCVLAVRPLNKPSYIIQWGGISPSDILSVLTWLAAIKILNSIAAVVTIPVISTLLAQAAIVYCSRRKEGQVLNMRQVFALADRGWSDIPILWGSWGANQLGTSSRFLWLAALLLLISAIQQPIQSGLVNNELVVIMTCVDEPVFSCDPGHLSIAVAYDPEPGDMALLPQNLIVQQVSNELVYFNEMDVQYQMWIDHPYVDGDLIDSYSDPAERRTFFWNVNELENKPGNITREFFVTILDNGTTTGVLRQHALRFNSSVECTNIPRQSFPHPCPGNRPFEASFSQPDLEIRVCAAGEFGVSPWTVARDRQDIEEDLFLGVTISSDFMAYSGWQSINRTNFTTHCKARTTRGYFEIGNYRNNYTYGPLINRWPDPLEMAYEWNDHLGVHSHFQIPSNEDISMGAENPIFLNWGNFPPDPFGTYALVASGPLMTSAISMFGNDSFFFIASNSSHSTFPPALEQICQRNMVPFSRIGLLMFNEFQGVCSEWNLEHTRLNHDEGYLNEFLWAWVANFQNERVSEEALMSSMFLANRAMLTIPSAAAFPFGARSIYTAPGLQAIKPKMPLAGKIIVSTLIALQLAGIAFLVRFIYKIPTWTPALDAMAVARLGKSMRDEDLPAIGPVSEKDMRKLTQLDGLVGVVDDEHIVGNATQSPENTETKPPIKVGLGAQGLIHRGLVARKPNKKYSQVMTWFRRRTTPTKDQVYQKVVP